MTFTVPKVSGKFYHMSYRHRALSGKCRMSWSLAEPENPAAVRVGTVRDPSVYRFPHFGQVPEAQSQHAEPFQPTQ
jgi:hypothetical protein